MPTNANAYNTRVTDEALEKRFRDTFKSQAGAELINDLFASGVIVPVVDFTAAAEGSQLGQNLQTAWDFSTGSQTSAGTSDLLIDTPGFWKVAVNAVLGGNGGVARIFMSDGLSNKTIWRFSSTATGTNQVDSAYAEMVVFLRSGDQLYASSGNTDIDVDTTFRQIADVYGNLIEPTGFTSS